MSYTVQLRYSLYCIGYNTKNIPQSVNDACLSWSSWVDSSSCELNYETGKGFRHRARNCSNDQNAIDHDVVECTPRECINNNCNCEVNRSENLPIDGKQFQFFTNGECSSEFSIYIFK